jgi:cytochrome d ubiquinol oxidase subunit II
MTLLSIIWFGLAALLLAVYSVTDGFDLGAGIVYGFTKDAGRKKRILSTISPIWSGNEVWLLAGIGSLLAAFPPVYSALLSSLYVPVILVLMALVFRAGGVELRTKVEGPRLARFLDGCILAGSLVPAWGIGLAAGNVLLGMPLDAEGAVKGSWLFFLNPFSIVAGFASLAAFAVHGLAYVATKTRGEDREAFVGFAITSLGIFAVIVAALAVSSVFLLHARFAASQALVGFWIFAALAVVGYMGVFMDLRARRIGGAFAASAIGLLSIVGMSACLLFPVMIPSNLGAANDLVVANAASSDRSLLAILVLAAIGVPLIAVYTIVAYRSFRGQAKPAEY